MRTWRVFTKPITFFTFSLQTSMNVMNTMEDANTTVPTQTAVTVALAKMITSLTMTIIIAQKNLFARS